VLAGLLVLVGGLYLCRAVPSKGAKVEPLLQRITFDQAVLRGKPVIRGMRISVEMVLELLAKGATQQEILEDFPELVADDLRAALLYAHHLVAGDTVLDRIAA
jgi:uncharacterized protein (DUF433 family)